MTLKLTHARKPLSWAILPENLRSDLGDQAELLSLGKSYLENPIHPLIAAPDGTMIDGSRRVLALRMLGESEADFAITDEVPNDELIRDIQFDTARQRRGLSDYDVWKHAEKKTAVHPEWTRKQLAERLYVDTWDLTRILAASDCPAEAQEAFKEGRIGKSAMYVISKGKDEAEKLALFAASVRGETRDQLERTRRANAKPVSRESSSGGKPSKFRYPSTTGAIVAISGVSLDYDELIDLCKETIEALKIQRKDSVLIGTAQKVWAEQAAKRKKDEEMTGGTFHGPDEF